MKKLTVICLLSLLFISCECNNCADHRKFVVTDFSKKRVDTLFPNESKTYVGYLVKVKGKTNDSIKISRKGYNDIILNGEIDTLISNDYYGTEDVIWIFNPYNATHGQLEIEYKL